MPTGDEKKQFLFSDNVQGEVQASTEDSGGDYSNVIYGLWAAIGIMVLMIIGVCWYTSVVKARKAEKKDIASAPKIEKKYLKKGGHLSITEAEPLTIGQVDANTLGFANTPTVPLTVDGTSISGEAPAFFKTPTPVAVVAKK